MPVAAADAAVANSLTRTRKHSHVWIQFWDWLRAL
jgi:hypothetical protein